MRQDEINRAIILIYRSRNAHDFVNYSMPGDALDKLPMAGLLELQQLYKNLEQSIVREVAQREKDGMPFYSREHYEKGDQS